MKILNIKYFNPIYDFNDSIEWNMQNKQGQYHNCKFILVRGSQSSVFIAKSAPMVIL